MSLYQIAQKIAAPEQCLLFVYGTLMQGEEAHEQMAGSEFLGKVLTAPKYSMLDLGNDFYAITEGTEQIPGELYLLDTEEMDRIDDWEYDIYSRQPIELANGVYAYAYIV